MFKPVAHRSEDSQRLEVRTAAVDDLSQLDGISDPDGGVHLFWFPFPRTNDNANDSADAYRRLAGYSDKLNDSSVLCVLTTPADAALLLPHLESKLRFQLWVAVKTTPELSPPDEEALPNRHAALLIFTKYDGSLRHTKTRVAYTYCPACGKTTKDYGGKKHTYHEYGTMISDVWRDIECDPRDDIHLVVNRLCDLFGLNEYGYLRLVDMRRCSALLPTDADNVSDPAPGPTQTGGLTANTMQSSLINEDCLVALRSLPDDSIDFCFADPPYNLKKRYDKWDDSLESVEYFEWCDTWLSELCRVLKPGHTLAVLNIPLWAVRHYQHLNSIMNFQAWVAWDGLSFPVRMIMPAHYAIVCFSKGRPRRLPLLSNLNNEVEKEFVNPLAEFYCLRSACVARRSGSLDRTSINDLWHDIHRLKHNSRRVNHPCQLPPALMRRLFSLFTHPNEIILDCFNGAGTSTLVAEQMNRRFTGIEISEQYHALALSRHEQMASGIDPFGKADSVPAAKNSPVQRLPKQKYEVSKKALQLDVKRIANELGRLPTKDEVRQFSKFPIDYFEKYFVSWGEVCAAARTTGMSENPLPDEAPGKQGSFTF